MNLLNAPPLAHFDSVPMHRANECLRAWEHKRGPCVRPEGYGAWAHALFIQGEPVAVVTAHTLVREYVGGRTEAGEDLRHLTRAAAVELTRLCSNRAAMNRVALRMWRELVFPRLGFLIAISYQHAEQHTGNIYRFDGWERLVLADGGGPDTRSPSGNAGTDRWVWAWPPGRAEELRSQVAPAPKRKRPERHPSLFDGARAS